MAGNPIFDHLHLRHPMVRDLAWAVFSPSLVDSKTGLDVMDGTFLGISKDSLFDFHSLLRALDSNPEPLQDAIGNSTKRLGDYFEALIEFWLRHLSCCHKIERHWRPRHEHEMLGDFNFLYFSDLIGSTCHMEVACKYYLLQGDPENLASYKGLDKEDTLEKKIFSLRRKLAQSSKNKVKALLEHEHFFPLVSACLVKGYIMYPLNADASFIPIPTEGIHKNHGSGWWARAGDRTWKERVGDTRLLVLPREEWLAPREYREDDPFFLNHSFVRDTPLPQKPPLLLGVWHLHDGVWHEHERGMIVA